MEFICGGQGHKPVFPLRWVSTSDSQGIVWSSVCSAELFVAGQGG